MSSQRHSFLVHNIVAFVRLLRSLGLGVTPQQVVSFVEGLKCIDMSHPDDFREVARVTMVSRHEHLRLFEQAFGLFWRVPGAVEVASVSALVSPGPATDNVTCRQSTEVASAEASSVEMAAYSADELLRRKDFAELTPDERERVRKIIRERPWEIEATRSRRKIRSKSRRRYPDMRQTLRSNLRYGGEPLRLFWRSPKFKPRPVVAICDISGSMEAYSRILLEFLHALTTEFRKTEAFVFGTRLTRITPYLRQSDVERSLKRVAEIVKDWAGGTRTGMALRRLNFDWGRRVLAGKAIVLLISDGWDCGEIDLLKREMERLRRTVFRIVWLNPLLGHSEYQPSTRGMQAALPYVDVFVAAHSLYSLEQLGRLLKDIRRRQSS